MNKNQKIVYEEKSKELYIKRRDESHKGSHQRIGIPKGKNNFQLSSIKFHLKKKKGKNQNFSQLCFFILKKKNEM